MSEPRVPDDRSFLKNEIARLSNENRRLQKILNDMNSAIADGRQNATEPDRYISKIFAVPNQIFAKCIYHV